ncbi:MAG: hypothetical protein LBJ74_04255, partial [Heliobacteriaceae bacterium]|nr:hypothetical protein [Heliobacteriaceae bacterium]
MQNHVGTNHQLAMQAKIPPNLDGAPVMQGDIPVNPEILRQNAQDSYVGGRTKQIIENDTLAQVAISVPIWYGLCQSMDYFAKKCRGKDYEKTIQGKMGAWGDGVAHKLTTGKTTSGPVAGFNKAWGQFTTFLSDKVVNKSGVLRAFRDTPAEPTNKMARAQREGMIGFLQFDYEPPVEDFINKPTKYAK